ncbi:MAG TPA: hypothetical protein PLH43_09075 [Acetivibrio sp.]|nr:hypothetical protein [Acetivibrio sp.]
MRNEGMFDNNCYVYKKEVDWSLLHQGLTIPVTIQVVFEKTLNSFLPRGQSKEIYLVLGAKTYKAELRNQKFDERKYPNRKDFVYHNGIEEKIILNRHL